MEHPWSGEHGTNITNTDSRALWVRERVFLTLEAVPPRVAEGGNKESGGGGDRTVSGATSKGKDCTRKKR